MTQRWAYVGKLGPGDALDWDGNNDGNIPVSGWLPDLHTDAFWAIMRLANEGQYQGRQVDWGAWAIKVNGTQLKQVLADIYGAEKVAQPWPVLKSYLDLADELGEANYVAFVAAEL